MTNTDLDKLINSGCISGYHYSNEEYEPGSGSRETERLVLVFPNGMSLKLETFCSGSAENSILMIEAKPTLEGFNSND